MESAEVLVAGDARHRHGTFDVAEAAELLGDGDRLPPELAVEADMHEVGAADAAAHGERAGERPGRLDAVGARLEHLHRLAGPEPVVAVMRLVEGDAQQLAGQGESHEHDAPIDVADAAALIGVSFDADGGFHGC